ncbi:MAG TPA: carboxypeptidase-like regulatory domain-containing protein [Bryobacteraceae bacterium]|nr:carboxypeptidase-like regulatory domain-containing protein [Bryobacteraceae bacterium]
MRRPVNRWVSAAVLVVAAGARMWAQTTAGLTGTVTDTSGAVIAGAKVTLTGTDTGIQRSTASGESGEYEFLVLPPGTYSVTVQKEGFKQFTRGGVRLEVNQVARIDFALQLGAVTETVEVKAAAPLLESNTSSVGQVIETKAVSDLPLNGRNFAQLAILSPGVIGVGFGPSGTIGSGTRPDDTRPGAELMANGNREMSNNFMLDGVDDNFRRNALITLRPTVEDIQEFKMQTNLFGAEQGRSSGATVNVITKSGSNSLHGSVFEFIRNNDLDARNFFNAAGTTQQPPYHQNQFGASLGGPVVRNRLFFFTDYEGFRKQQGTNTSVNTVPTAAERQGDFSQVRPIYDPATVRPAPGTASGYVRDPFPGNQIPANRFDSVTSRLVQAYPLPTQPGLVGNQFTNPVFVQNYDQGDVRIDWTANSKDTIFGRFSKQDTLTLTPSTFGLRSVPGLSIPLSLGNSSTYTGKAPLNSYNSVIGVTHVFSPTFLVDFRMGYSRFNLQNVDMQAPSSGPGLGLQLGVPYSNQLPQANGVPIFGISGYTGIGGPAAIPTIRLENTFNPVVNFTLIRGGHTIRFGTNLVRRQIIDFQMNQGNGNFSFDSTFTDNPNSPANTGDGMANFLLGTYGSLSQDLQLVWAGYRVVEMGSYIADDWRVTSRLTLNLGLRYEFLPPPVEVANRMMNLNNQTGKVLIAGFNAGRHVDILTQWKLFAPRFGFAYQLAKSTVLRGGFGLFYNAAGTGGGLYRMHRYPPFAAVDAVTVNEVSPNYKRVQDGLPPAPPSDFQTVSNNPIGSFLTVPANFKNAYAQQFNFGIEQELPAWNVVFKAFYLGNLGRDLDINYNYNQPVPGPGSPALRMPLHVLAPNVVGDTIAATDGDSDYHSLQLTAEKRFSNGLSFLSAYTFAHSIDNVPLQEGGNGEGPVPQDPRYRFLDRGNSSFDIRHRFTQTLIYDLPVGRGKRFHFDQSWANTLLGNWQTNLILTAQTGLPFTPVLANSVANTGTSSRPNLVGDYHIANPSLTQWFNTALNGAGAPWATPAQYTFGNAGRGILVGPGRTNVDFSLFKQFPITERFQLQFRGEFFNVLNHPQFDLPNATIGSPSAGKITGTVGTPRDIQLSLRLAF